MSSITFNKILEQTESLENTSKKRRIRRRKLQTVQSEEKHNAEMSSKEDVLAARQAKKLAKQQGKKDIPSTVASKEPQANLKQNAKSSQSTVPTSGNSPNSKDEVDRAAANIQNISLESSDVSKEQIKAERAAKKAAKQAKKKGGAESGDNNQLKPDKEMTVKDVVETLKDIVNVSKEMKEVTAKPEESGKSKAELKAERRAKQEAQRAAKQAKESASQVKAADVKSKANAVAVKEKEEKPIKQKTLDKQKAKLQKAPTINWFQHLQNDKDKEILKNIAINSNLHPAIVKLGVQLATRVVTGSNARCIAFLDALKKMVRDYSLPAKTEFGRGLESALTASVNFLWSARAPAASQTNALKFFRYQLTQLPNNVDEFDAKKHLQEEIDRYIREQIDMAGEAISIAVRQKISDGDNILTYGCSSLIERILLEAWAAGVRFRAVVAGSRHRRDAATMLRRLARAGLPASYYDITAIHFVMPTINKVLLGASALLANGGVVSTSGTAAVALAARTHNVPALVACETHKFSHTVKTDAMDYTDTGDPDDLIDRSDEHSPLKNWRTNPNLTLLNLTYDVTPPSLITAVVTELAILPCTSAPVVLRFKLSEYGI